ncbi:MAG: twin-arginine translocation signal domain-containing protein, partial [Gammaproteobacteria bacterium]|nr:twin-arginine translocation signal domain-containing protein [Gammaproteobacteria bacterium]
MSRNTRGFTRRRFLQGSAAMGVLAGLEA